MNGSTSGTCEPMWACSTEEANVRERGRGRDRRGRGDRRHPERRRLVAGGDGFVRVDANAGVHPEEERLHDAGRPRQRVQATELVEAVGDQEPHTYPDRQLQLLVGLVASVERDPRGGDPGAHARFDLAAARREEVEPLVRGQPEHRVRGERLHGVERLRERETRRAEPGDQIRSIEHQQRRAVSRCERHGALSRDPQPVGPERRIRRPRVRDDGRGDAGLRSAGPDRLRSLSHRPDP